MRVQASLQFYCKSTGRSLKTKLGTEARNLVVFRPRTLPMRCVFCGGQHYRRLVKYHRPDMKHRPTLGAVRSTVAKRHDVMTSERLGAAKPSPGVAAKAR